MYIVYIMYMTGHVHMNTDCSFRTLFKWMHRALTSGLGTGTSLALWLNLLGGLDQPLPLLPYELTCPYPSGFQLHWPSLVLGLLAGLLLGPLLEAFVALRALIYQSALRRAGTGLGVPAGVRPLYRIQ